MITTKPWPQLFPLFIILLILFTSPARCFSRTDPLAVQREYFQAYADSPFSLLSRDYFARFNRDNDIKPSAQEVLIEQDWLILYPDNASPLTRLMANYLQQFLNQRMQLALTISESDHESLNKAQNALILLETTGGDPNSPESFTIKAQPQRILIKGADSLSLRDGIVKLASIIGLKQAPILPVSEQIYRPRKTIRLGTVPWMGSYRDLIFSGYNAVLITGSLRPDIFEAAYQNIGSLRKLSTSNAIPELRHQQDPQALARLKKFADQAHKHGLKVYLYFHMEPRFLESDPVFQSQPEIRGALINDGPPYNKYHLCTSHPLVRRYLTESVRGVFEQIPFAQGLVVIIGGEGFCHCFMRPYDVPPGHQTNCLRCDKLPLETVIADLCDYLGSAARSVNPRAEVLAWPYSAVFFWPGRQDDRIQLKFIQALKPGTALFSDVVKDDYLEKPGGIKKLLWDYSIDEIGPGDRALKQIQACHNLHRRMYLHTEPELAFEASRLPYIPCMDRWARRADALAACPADGIFVWPFFKPNFGSTSEKVFQYFWWDPAPDVEDLLQQLAARIAGRKAAPQLRRAWKFVSQSIEYSPVIDMYISGPMYLGPAHPICAQPGAKLPDCFIGAFYGPRTSGVFESPQAGAKLFLEYYRRMEHCLSQAHAALNDANPLVPDSYRLTFAAEKSATSWLYHTVRTTANFYESCLLRDSLTKLTNSGPLSNDQRRQAQKDFDRWRRVLLDERQNSLAALPVMQQDMRLDFYYGYNGGNGYQHKLPGADMIKLKLELLDHDINDYLPLVAQKLGLQTDPGSSDKPNQASNLVVFPAPAGIESSQDYQLEVDGCEVFCYQDFRLNTDFPRSLFGMKVSPQAYAIFDFTGPVTVRITINSEDLGDLNALQIRPLSLAIKPKINGNTLEFTLDHPCDLTLDPLSTGLRVLHLFTNLPEKNVPSPSDPNVVYFGPGVHDIEDLQLNSSQTLYLAGGAVLRPCPTRLLLPDKEPHYTGASYYRTVFPIRAAGSDITIRGRGIISGQRALPAGKRFGLFQGTNIKNLQIRGVTFTRSTAWTLLLDKCHDCLLDRVRILGYFTNSDGICFHACRDSRATNCFIHTADDCYEVKSSASSIVFENSQAWCDAGCALGVCHEIDSLVEDVTWRNMTILHYTYKANSFEGITSRGAIFVHPAFGGTVKNLRFQNITVENCTTHRPLILIYNVKHPKPGEDFAPGKPFSKISNLTFENIKAINVLDPKILIMDQSNAGLIHDITFNNVRINDHLLEPNDPILDLPNPIKNLTIIP